MWQQFVKKEIGTIAYYLPENHNRSAISQCVNMDVERRVPI